MLRPIEVVVMGFELAGVVALLVGAVFASAEYVTALVRRQAGPAAYLTLRQRLGKAILIGLEFLVAADIIRSVALDLTFASISILGLLVLIRTFLS